MILNLEKAKNHYHTLDVAFQEKVNTVLAYNTHYDVDNALAEIGIPIRLTPVVQRYLSMDYTLTMMKLNQADTVDYFVKCIHDLDAHIYRVSQDYLSRITEIEHVLSEIEPFQTVGDYYYFLIINEFNLLAQDIYNNNRFIQDYLNGEHLE